MACNVTLVAIGEKYFTIGASKIRAHASKWKDIFESSAASAVVLICEIHSSKSSVWEIERISSTPDLARKTVFVLLPLSCDKDYARVRDLAGRLGLQLPDYDSAGWIHVSYPEPAHYPFSAFDRVIAARLVEA
jgi:hypothetical protein